MVQEIKPWQLKNLTQIQPQNQTHLKFGMDIALSAEIKFAILVKKGRQIDVPLAQYHASMQLVKIQMEKTGQEDIVESWTSYQTV